MMKERKWSETDDVLVTVSEAATGYNITNLVLQGISIGKAEDAMEEIIESGAMNFGTYEPWELEVSVGDRNPCMSDYRLYPVLTVDQLEKLLERCPGYEGELNFA